MAAAVTSANYQDPTRRDYHVTSYASRLSEMDGRQSSVLSERVVEHQVKVPKKVIREDVVEKVMVVPERVITEEMINEVQTVRERIVELAKPVVKEKYVEVPDIVYVEKVIEVPEKVIQEKVKEVPRTEYRDRVIEVPKVIKKERIVEIPEIQYREVPYEKIVEIPEIQEQVVVREVPVTQYIDKVINEYVPVEVPQDVVRHVPVPLAVSTKFHYELPQPKPAYETVDLNVYVPRFIEVPVPTEFLDDTVAKQAQNYIDQIAQLAAQPGPSLRDIEELAGSIKNSGISNVMERSDYQTALKTAWHKGDLEIQEARQRGKAYAAPAAPSPAPGPTKKSDTPGSKNPTMHSTERSAARMPHKHRSNGHRRRGDKRQHSPRQQNY